VSGQVKIIAPGLLTTIQDRGRFGYQDVGVPDAGALDRVALTLANALVGNPLDTAAMEILALGPVLEVVTAPVRFALVGGTGCIVESDGGTVAVAPGRSIRLRPGERLRVNALGPFNCACLAVQGGFDVPSVLESASTFIRNRFGGLQGRALQAGDLLDVLGDATGEEGERALSQPFEPELDRPIRVVFGPQNDYFSDETRAAFLHEPYTISPQADRMGYRLEGAKLAHSKGYDIVSDGIVPGCVQVPGSGQPIVLLSDAQTTGGYPKIATVISSDLPLIGRRRAGGTIHFAAVTQSEAENIRRADETRIARLIEGLQGVVDVARLDQKALYGGNLVDGIVSALE
jgi:biotin-dependent carboxylase-like uncharacterized protein